MSEKMRVVAVIPARMGSSRFPGKPLWQVHGLPMVEHVRRRALLCRAFSEVVVATCDREIAEAIRHWGGISLMTSSEHPAATDRVAEAARSLDCTHVVNVQGDEILILPRDLERFVQAIQDRPQIPAWNAVARLETQSELSDRCVVKCAISISGRILFCSRDFSQPEHSSNGGSLEPIRKVLGILGYRKDFLERYGSLIRTPLEIKEAIDQSRILEHDFPLQAVEFERGYAGVNESREAEQAQHSLEEDPLQRGILKEVLSYQ